MRRIEANIKKNMKKITEYETDFYCKENVLRFFLHILFFCIKK